MAEPIRTNVDMHSPEYRFGGMVPPTVVPFVASDDRMERLHRLQASLDQDNRRRQEPARIDAVYLATVLSETAMQMRLWRGGFSFDGVAAERLAEIEAILRGDHGCL